MSLPTNVQNLHTSGSLTGFGRVVSDARHAKRLTQEQAAALLGISRRKLIDIESDRYETLPRYERAGILAVLMPERDTQAPKSERRTWRRVLLGSAESPRAWLDLEEESGQWWSALGYNNGRHGGLEPFRGPYYSREAAERNAAAFGLDFMKARGATVAATVIARMLGFPSAKRAESAQLEIHGGEWMLEKKQTGSGVNVYHNGELVAEMFGPADYIEKGFNALKSGGTIDAGFEQRHGLEVYFPDGSSPSE